MNHLQTSRGPSFYVVCSYAIISSLPPLLSPPLSKCYEHSTTYMECGVQLILLIAHYILSGMWFGVAPRTTTKKTCIQKKLD